ncbi:MAG: DUF1523 family protein [Alphaproteobacteria bacterium]|nr:MAG: DUF1523 family protein [Alphaproteobacteria bacterium]
MVWIKRAVIALLLAALAAFLHYTLPRHDIVRIVNTAERRVDVERYPMFWTGSGSTGNASNMRDVYFIEAIDPEGRPRVYRNQDTGWGWPPYFKFDSSNLQAKARDLVSTKENPKWVVVTRYGWRNEFISIYPNAIEIRPASGPDERIIPWFNIVFLSLLALLALVLWRAWRRFRARAIDPVLERLDEGVDEARFQAEGVLWRLRRWWRERTGR